MTNQNNATQPVLTDDEIRAVWVEHGLDDEAVEDFARAIESALLSKLRAPVADEQERRQQAGIEVMGWLRENGAPHSIYSRMSACLFGDPDWPKARAALASEEKS